MALYQNGILISGANTLPQMTLAEYQALPVSERPTYWERTDLNYSNIPASDVTYGSGSVEDALDGLNDIENITVTYPSIYVDTSNIKCFKCGKSVTISFVGAKLNTSVNRYGVILQNVPTPANGAYVCNLLYGVTGSVTQTSAYINSNATSVQINDALSSGAELYGYITYLTE